MARATLILLAAFAAGAVSGFLLRPRAAPPATFTAARPEPAPASTAVPPPLPAPVEAAAPRPASPVASTIRGRVRTDRGAPVAGLRLRTVPALDGAPAAETVTGPSGEFRFEGLALAVAGFATDREDLLLRCDEDTIEPGMTAEVVASKPVVLPVSVLLPDGTAPGAARLVCFRRQPDSEDLVRPWQPSGRVLLPEGLYDIFASAGTDGEFRGRVEGLLLLRSAPPSGIEVRLAECCGVRGRVLLPEGFWAGGLYVQCSGNDASDSGSVGPGGRYALTELAPGAATITVGTGGMVFGRAEVTIGAGMTECDVTAGPPPPGEAVVARLLGPEGHPLPEADGYRLPDGSFLYRRSGSEAGLRVSAPGLGEKRVAIPPGCGEVEVRFEEPAFLEVDPGECPGVRDVRVIEGDATGAGSIVASGDPCGPLRLGPFQPQSLRVVAHAWFYSVAEDIRLRSGENAVVFRPPSLYTLRVALPEDAAGGSFSVSPVEETWRGRCVFGDAGETVSIPDLPAGRYRLERFDAGPADGVMEVSVPAEEVVQFVPDRLDALRVDIADGDGLLARTGLATGDLIVAIDGRTFRSGAQATALLSLAAAKGTVVLTVLRGGEEIPLTVPGTDLIGSAAIGGRLTAVAR